MITWVAPDPKKGRAVFDAVLPHEGDTLAGLDARCHQS
jgi:hypothetical protein